MSSGNNPAPIAVHCAMTTYLVQWTQTYPSGRTQKFYRVFSRLGNVRNFIRRLEQGRPASKHRKAWHPVPEANIHVYDMTDLPEVDYSMPEPKREARRGPAKPYPGALLLGDMAAFYEPGTLVPPVQEVTKFFEVRKQDAREAMRLARQDPRFEAVDPRNPRSQLRRSVD